MPIFDLIAGLASILGLIFSILAFIQARRASDAAKRAAEAAKEARDGILIRTLADEFEIACNKMDELLDLIVHDRLAEAAIRAHEVTAALSEIPFRRSAYLNEHRRNELLDSRTQIEIIELRVYKGGDQPFTAKQKEEIVRICQSCSKTLRENLGTIKGEVDVGGER